MSMFESHRLRAAVEQHRAARARSNQRFPASLRDRAAAYARRRRREGIALKTIAAELELSLTTVQRWLGRPERESFRRVEVRPTPSARSATGPAPAGLVLLSPQGYRVEGLDVAGVAALLRVLP